MTNICNRCVVSFTFNIYLCTSWTWQTRSSFSLLSSGCPFWWPIMRCLKGAECRSGSTAQERRVRAFLWIFSIETLATSLEVVCFTSWLHFSMLPSDRLPRDTPISFCAQLDLNTWDINFDEYDAPQIKISVEYFQLVNQQFNLRSLLLVVGNVLELRTAHHLQQLPDAQQKCFRHFQNPSRDSTILEEPVKYILTISLLFQSPSLGHFSFLIFSKSSSSKPISFFRMLTTFDSLAFFDFLDVSSQKCFLFASFFFSSLSSSCFSSSFFFFIFLFLFLRGGGGPGGLFFWTQFFPS